LGFARRLIDGAISAQFSGAGIAEPVVIIGLIAYLDPAPNSGEAVYLPLNLALPFGLFARARYIPFALAE
jgi:hypothetical protein